MSDCETVLEREIDTRGPVSVSKDTFDEYARIKLLLPDLEVVVFEVEGEYYAYPNVCPHQSGPVGDGAITGTCRAEFDGDTLSTDITWQLDDRILNCPWHGWEFELTTGECLSRPGVDLPSIRIDDDDDQIIVHL